MSWGINHVTSSPQHQRANGKAEAAVKVIKHLMIKCTRNREDQYEALMELRNVPRQDTGLSPNEMVFGRRTRTLLPDLNPGREENDVVKRKRESRKKSVKRYYDKTARDLPYVKEGQNVYFQYKEHERWILGRVLEQCSDSTYMIQAQNGAVYRRNRMHIRPTKVEAIIRDRSPCTCYHSNSDTPDKSDIMVPQHQPICVSHELDNRASPIKRDEEKCATNTSPSKTMEGTTKGSLNVPPRRSGRERREPTHLKDFVRYK
ncbi:uncharacterized protein [Argopecten irradians]|uniref:uncharacterized protein n=1 Tax=Argopecten irradians TaxID=31199 RepID=UPI00371B9063